METQNKFYKVTAVCAGLLRERKLATKTKI